MAVKKTETKKRTVSAASKKKSPQETKKPEPAKKEPAKKLVTAKYLAECFGVTERRIQQLSQEGVIKAEPGGRGKEGYQYDFARSLIAIGRYYREKADSRRSSESIDLEAAKLEAMKIKNEKDSLELDEIKKDLHKSADIERVMGAALSRLRINLLAIPLGVAPLVRDKKNVNEIAEIITERISRALSEIASVDIDKMLDDEKGMNTEYE
jgi:phage terminase Nu1 subunit (DNA packaging protein)